MELVAEPHLMRCSHIDAHRRFIEGSWMLFDAKALIWNLVDCHGCRTMLYKDASL